MTNRTRQIIVVVAVFVIALASLGTVIGLLVNTGQLSEYSDGFRFVLNGSRATITGYEGSDSEVVVPDKLKGHRVVGVDKDAFAVSAGTIKSIKFNCSYSSFTFASEALAGLTSLESVVLPSNLKEIASGTFSGCTSLKSVIMPNSVTLIGDNAFKGCNSLNFIYYSENYTTDGEGAIKNNALYLPSSLLEIGANAFEDCSALDNLFISKELEKIGNYAFGRCSNLTNVTLDADSEISSIGDYAFFGTMLSSSTSTPIYFPNLVSVGAYAFSRITNSSFTYMGLPESVTTIGEGAFARSTGLNRIEMAEDTKIETMGEGVFQGCANLRYVTLPSEIKEIPAKTFMGCYRLLYNQDFVIGKSVESIGDGAFSLYAVLADEGDKYHDSDDKDTTPPTYSNVDFTDYSKYVITVDEDNEHFTIIRLEDNKRDDDANSTFRQGLITDVDGATVYAYYGSYDTKSYSPTKGRTFRFLDVEGRILGSIATIKPYAFAGVKFEYIELPVTIKQIGEYAFVKSSVTTCYSSAINWEFTEWSFSKEIDAAPVIDVLFTQSRDGLDAFIKEFEKYDITAGTASGTID